MTQINQYSTEITPLGGANELSDADFFDVDKLIDGDLGIFQSQKITFQSLATYFGGTIANTWTIPLTAFVDPASGTIGGVVGDGNKPFQTIEQANASGASFVRLLPGIYAGTNVLESKIYYSDPGVNFPINSKITDNGLSINAAFIGNAVFGTNSFGIETTADSNLYVECEEFDNTRNFVFTLSDTLTANVFVRVKKGVVVNTDNGAAFGSQVRGGSKITCVTPYWYCNHWSVSYGANLTAETSTFILRCPDVKTLGFGWAGNIAKGLVSVPGTVAGSNVRFELDLQGGILVNEHPVQTLSFGAFDSALMSYTNNLNPANNCELIFKNGTVEGGQLFGLCHHFAVTVGKIVLDNIILKSETRALNIYLSNNAGNGQRVEHVFKNVDFQGTQPDKIGNSQICHFKNTTQKITDAAANEIIEYDPINPADPSILYFIDHNAELENAGGGQFVSNNIAGTLFGMLNTHCTEVLSVGLPLVVDTWGGFNTIPTLKLPTQ